MIQKQIVYLPIEGKSIDGQALEVAAEKNDHVI